MADEKIHTLYRAVKCSAAVDQLFAGTLISFSIRNQIIDAVTALFYKNRAVIL